MPGERWSIQAGPLIARLRGARGETAGLLKQGFEHTTHWAHATTALFIFATDFLKPNLPQHCMLWIAIIAPALLVFVWLATHFHILSRELGSAIVVFSLITASLSSAMVGLEYAAGEKGEKNGALVALVPGLEGLQEQLFTIAAKLDDVLKGQKEETQRQDQRHTEAMEGQKRLERQVMESAASITPAARAALTRPYEELTEIQKKHIARLEGDLDLNQRQVKSALEIVGEANVPPERLAAKLLEIAGKFKDLRTAAAAAAQPGDDSKITTLKTERKRRSRTANSARRTKLWPRSKKSKPRRWTGSRSMPRKSPSSAAMWP